MKKQKKAHDYEQVALKKFFYTISYNKMHINLTLDKIISVCTLLCI